MVKEFNSLEEIQKYYDKKTNTYIFKESGETIQLIKLNFDFNTKSNIDCLDIIAWDIYANNINAYNINAYDINANIVNARDINACYINTCGITAHNIIARDIKVDYISYFALCFAYENIKCKSIKGRRINAKHFVLDGKIKIGNKMWKNININNL